MPMINEDDASDHMCPFNSFNGCAGAKCMAWAWTGHPFDNCETDNLVTTDEGQRPIGTPPAPEGDGWEADGKPYNKGYHQSAKLKLPAATAQRWARKRKVTQGRCGRVMVDSPYDNF